MLDLFVAALMTVADPTVVAQAPTTSAVAMSTQSKKPSTSQGYEKVYSACQDVDGYRVTPSEWGPQYPPQESAHNDFSPFFRDLYKRWGMVVGEVLSPERMIEMGLKVTELEAPKHGKIKAINAATYRYTFMPDLGYVGKDRVVYEIEAKGKRYKATINFWVVPVVMDDYQECKYQKFNGSSIDPGTLNGSPGYSVTKYTMGGLPFGKDIIRVDFADLSGDGVGQTIGNTITLDINAAGNGWFIDKTPGVNEEFVATSNPNEWVASSRRARRAM